MAAGEGKATPARAAITPACAPLTLVAALGLAGAALAEAPRAVGRVFAGDGLRPGQAVCTGTLVAPDLVLTAGHCIDRPGLAAAALRFEAGRDGRRIAAARRGAAVLRLPADPGSAPLADDLALLRLDRPIARRVVAPLPLAAAGGDWIAGPAVRWGYTRRAPERPDAATCPVLVVQGGVAGLGCAAESGHSGAPALVRGPDGWTVAAVFVAAGRVPGQPASWAALPGAMLRARIEGDGD